MRNGTYYQDFEISVEVEPYGEVNCEGTAVWEYENPVMYYPDGSGYPGSCELVKLSLRTATITDEHGNVFDLKEDDVALSRVVDVIGEELEFEPEID